MDWKRWFRHLFATRAGLRRAFPPGTLSAIEAAIARLGATALGRNPRRDRGLARSRPRVARPQSARSVRSRCSPQLAVWDTDANNGVLIYVLLADRDVEIVADRGYNGRVSPEEWACRLPCHGVAFPGRAVRAGRARRHRSRERARGRDISRPVRARAIPTSCRTGPRYFEEDGTGDADQARRIVPMRRKRAVAALTAARARRVQRVPEAEAAAAATAAAATACRPGAARDAPVPVRARRDRRARRAAGHACPTRGHAGGHRPPLRRRLRRAAPRESRRGSVVAGRGHDHRAADAVRAARRAQGRHRDQRRGDAALLLPEGREGRAADRRHLPDRHRQDRAGPRRSDRRRSCRSAVGPGVDAARVGAQGARRQRRPAAGARAAGSRTIRSAPTR